MEKIVNMSSVNSICVIGLYFGRFSNYFDLWLKSCEFNENIDFYIFGDAPYEKDLPKNVNLVYMTLDAVKQRAQDYLGFELSLETPYKCCDYKPIYGAIFRDYISSYEYWGHCDFDLIFGDILSFLEQYNYQQYDKFFALGHLSFYKNTQSVYDYIKLNGASVGYKEVFSQPQNCAFDEIGGVVQIYLKNNKPFFTKRLFADIAEPERYYRFKHSQYCYVNEPPLKNYRHQIFYWENGRVYCAFYDAGKLCVKEYCYIHFKHRPNFKIDFDVDSVNAFFITPKGFILKSGERVTKTLIQQLNPIKRFPFYETVEFLVWYVKRWYKRLFRKVKYGN